MSLSWADCLWAPGLALLAAYLVHTRTGLVGEPLDWAQYTLFAAAAAFCAACTLLRSPRLALAAAGAKYALSAVFFALTLHYVTHEYGQAYQLDNLWLLFLFTTLAISLCVLPRRRPRAAGPYVAELVLLGLLAVLTLHVGFKLFWNRFIPFEVLSLRRLVWVDSYIGEALIFLAVVWASFRALWPQDESLPLAEPPVRAAEWVIVAGLTFAAFIIHFNLNPIPSWLHQGHWNAYYLPAIWVREGAWVMWDIPTHYGPGITLILAWLPFESVRNNLFYLHAAGQTLATLFIFLLLWRPSRLISPWVALAVAIISTHALPFLGYAPASAVPSAGPLRFLPAYFGWLWVFALWRLRALPPRDFARLRHGGLAVWLLGVFWSAECGFFATAIVVPAYLAAGFAQRLPAHFPGYVRSAARDLGVIAALLAAFVAAVSFYYLLFLGYLPDYRMYTEFALSYAGGYGSLNLNFNGAALAHYAGALALLGASAATFSATRGRNAEHWMLNGLLASCLGGLWAVNVYGISRSTDNVFNNLSPLLICAMALAWRGSRESGTAPRAVSLLLTAVLGALVACHLYIGWDQRRLIQNEFRYNSPAVDVEPRIHDRISPLNPLIASLNPKKNDISFVYNYADFQLYAGSLRQWLPVGEAYGLERYRGLPSENYMLKYRRFADRVCHREGWIVWRKNEDFQGSFPALYQLLHEDYTLKENTMQGVYSVERYVRTTPCTLAPKPWIDMLFEPRLTQRTAGDPFRP